MKITIDNELEEITVHGMVSFKDLKKLAKFCKKNKLTKYLIKGYVELVQWPYYTGTITTTDGGHIQLVDGCGENSTGDALYFTTGKMGEA